MYVIKTNLVGIWLSHDIVEYSPYRTWRILIFDYLGNNPQAEVIPPIPILWVF